MRLVFPQREQHGALEHELVAMLRHRQPVQKALEGEPLEGAGDLLALVLRLVLEPPRDGSGQVCRRAVAHSRDSRYGRMTLVMRQASA